MVERLGYVTLRGAQWAVVAQPPAVAQGVVHLESATIVPEAFNALEREVKRLRTENQLLTQRNEALELVIANGKFRNVSRRTKQDQHQILSIGN